MTLNLENLLNLPKTQILNARQVSDFYLLHLQLTNEGISCPHCQKYLDVLHQTRYILVRDLSICGVEVYLKVPRRRFYCSQCQKYISEQLTWLEAKQSFTERFKQYIYERVKESTVEQVSRSENLTSKQVQNIFSRLAQIQIKNQEYGIPRRLSLDEFSRTKGQGNFATILTDLDKGSLLEVIDSHKSDDIIQTLKRLPLFIREQVQEVCVDMWGGFPKVIKEVFPNADIVIDRFHVQKLINKDLNKIRLNLGLKGLKNKNLLMTSESQLILDDKKQLESLLQSSPILRIAHELKEELVNIYNSDITSSRAIVKMKQWLKYARIIFKNGAATLSNHLIGICNYFTNRTTSGVTEGLNTRIKLILRQSYGFKNFDMMREKLLVCLFK
jgi:transposase